MLSNYKTLKTLGIYTVSGFLNKGIAFLFLPILTSYLQPADYGIVTLFGNVVSLITPFVGLSIITSISTDYFKYEKDRFSVYFSSILLLPVIITFFVCFILLLFGNRIAQYLEVPVLYLYAIPLLVLAGIFFEVLLTIIRNRNEAVFFGVITFLKTIFELGLSTVLIIMAHIGWQGRIVGWLVTGFLVILYATYYFYKKNLLTKKINFKHFPDELKYSVPIILNQFAIFSILSSDKFFIAEYLTKNEVGIYGVACQFGFIAFAISAAIIMSFNPYLYKALSEYSEQKKKEVVNRIFKFVGLMLLVCIGIAVATPFLYTYFISNKYHGGVQYVKWILLSYFFWFIYWLLLGFFYFFKMKRIIFIISLFSIISSLLLNFIFIRKYGTIGAIYSLNINCFLAMVGTILLLKYKFKYI